MASAIGFSTSTMPSSSARPTYTPDQIQQYYNYIGLPSASQLTAEAVQKLDVNEQLDFVSRLIRYQLCKVPFENLDLHYSPIKGISLNHTFLFDKIVTRDAGRGGYCMQNNAFFGSILCSLGFSVMSTGARVSRQIDDGTAGKNQTQEVDYGGFGHQVNFLIMPDGKKYFCDVGFGSSGPTFVVPLEDGFTAVNTGSKENVASSSRLHRGFTANNTHRGQAQELWIYSIKYGRADDDSKPWIQCYCFSETEFFPSDFEIMSGWVSTSRTSMFVNRVICSKFLMADDGQSLIGDVTLADSAIKERRFGENKSLAEIKSEKDRVEALERYLGVRLREDERMGISGFPSAIS